MNRTIKFLTLGVIISSLFGYLEWGRGNHQFLFETEWLVFQKIWSDPVSVLHPFVILPLLGQIVLACTLFSKKPGKIWLYIGLSCIALLLGMVAFAGILAMNFKMVGSVLPFFITSYFLVKSILNKEP